MNDGCPTPEKQAHQSKHDAGVQLNHRRNSDRGHSRYRLQVYHCVCGAWHVGHSSYTSKKRKLKDLAR